MLFPAEPRPSKVKDEKMEEEENIDYADDPDSLELLILILLLLVWKGSPSTVNLKVKKYLQRWSVKDLGGRYWGSYFSIDISGDGMEPHADLVVEVNPAWNPSADHQTVDRAYQIGQKKDVIVYRVMSSGTVEEKIYRKQSWGSNNCYWVGSSWEGGGPHSIE